MELLEFNNLTTIKSVTNHIEYPDIFPFGNLYENPLNYNELDSSGGAGGIGSVVGSSGGARTTMTSTIATLINNNSSTNRGGTVSTNDSSLFISTDLSITEQIADYLAWYYTPILVLTGSIGNILSVLVFFKTKLKKLSSSYYLAALGVSDTCFLWVTFIEWLNFFDFNFNHRPIFCQMFIYLSGVCSFLSVWFVVAFTVERFIAVLYPLKRQTMCTVRRAKIVLCGLTLLGCIESSPLLLLTDVRESNYTTGMSCDIRQEYRVHMRIFNYVDTVIVFAVPFTAIVILNSITGYTVWRVAGVRRTMTTHKRKPPVKRVTRSKQLTNNNNNINHNNNNNNTTHKCIHLNGQHSNKQTCPKTGRQRITNSSQMKVTKMLLLVSTVFVCLNLPSYVMRVRAFLELSEGTKTTIIIQYYCWQFFLTNFGINFVLYCVSGQNFRKAIIGMFKKASHQRQEGATQVTVSEYIRSTGSNASRRRIVARNDSSQELPLQELQSINSDKTTR